MNRLYYSHPRIFVDGVIPPDMSNVELISAACLAWGNCMAGEIPPNFGEVMTQIGVRLGVVLTPEKAMELADEWIAKRNEVSHGDEQKTLA